MGFKQENPDVDLKTALRVGDETPMAPVLRRTVKNWQPDKILCKRWGVPEPKLPDSDELPGAKMQRKYAEQVQVGLAKATAAPVSSAVQQGPAGSAADTDSRAQLAGDAAAAEPPRPPKSLFTSIF